MRGSIGRIASSSTNFSKQALFSSSHFSTFSGGGRGRGRGGGDGGASSDFTPNPQNSSQVPGKPVTQVEPDDEVPSFPPGVGHGRGKPILSPPIPPPPPSSSSSSWSSGVNPSIGRGKTFTPQSDQPESQSGQPKKPIFFRREDTPEPSEKPHFTQAESQSGQPKKPIFFSREDVPKPLEKPHFTNFNPVESMIPSLSSGGAGRGKPSKSSIPDQKPKEENRHARRQPKLDNVPLKKEGEVQTPVEAKDAAKKALEVLSRGDVSGGRGGGGGGGRGRGIAGRGRGRRGRGRGRGGEDQSEDEGDDDLFDLKLGDDADGEKFAKKMGPERMAVLEEAFDEMSYNVLPSPMQEEFVEAQDINNAIEYEPEYLVEFDNPDIDDKPPIPLRDALEKMKPFLMTYEGIKSQEEWEEIIEDLMTRVPQMKELLDMYCGPDRVTAKQQMQELERVAKTLPENVPPSVKRFTDRAVLSLQSNPGWGWDKKCQFMDKLVWEVSQQYK